MSRYRLKLAVLLLVLVAACNGGSPATHYYAAGSNWAIYLAWTEDTTGSLESKSEWLKPMLS